MSGTMPSFIAKLPPKVRLLIAQQCGRDWTRVYLDADGAVVIANNAGDRPVVQTMRRTELPPAGETRKALNAAKKTTKKKAKKTTPGSASPPTLPAFTEPHGYLRA